MSAGIVMAVGRMGKRRRRLTQRARRKKQRKRRGKSDEERLLAPDEKKEKSTGLKTRHYKETQDTPEERKNGRRGAFIERGRWRGIVRGRFGAQRWEQSSRTPNPRENPHPRPVVRDL
jgi:hypothetical protein